ncbi:MULTISPECIES: DUF3886 domain-containing protein [Brevibacillus]|uniref:DUF3886 domain-containing protein n=1 Tax=Brevibacillus TaxID=55080 RepID=UPI000D0F7466|nr:MULTISPECIES: DUF3886 domain-containing protein [Brevibacillus]MED1948892.1 DUF3886 domain-containing protein [Brevibacillus formosus]MED2001415.1 DUF3886 domain-containing protein [Brevibacillus formosus]MED2085500.1 DUF3886 domain-containing protein [Brevibacillus formosus]PSK11441.1 DUF3886 domain-containing protein [Brevibacillus sp. NRRL NRS-603]
MAKKQRKTQRQAETTTMTDAKSGLNSLKDMLNADALGALKQLEKEMKTEGERKAKAAAEQMRREQEERERNKSFTELLDDYEKKGGGKYS